jgi:hypothetical protein
VEVGLGPDEADGFDVEAEAAAVPASRMGLVERSHCQPLKYTHGRIYKQIAITKMVRRKVKRNLTKLKNTSNYPYYADGPSQASLFNLIKAACLRSKVISFSL